MASKSKPEKKPKAKTSTALSKKKVSFSRKKKSVTSGELGLHGGSADVDPVNFEELIDAAETTKDGKKLVDDAFIPDEAHSSLVEVDDWIDMPEPFCDVMGTEGLPCGHIVEAFGSPDSGKTTFASYALMGAQRANGIAILIDTEHKYNIKRAEAMGLNRKGFIITRAETIEEVFDKFVGWMKIIRGNDKWAKRKVSMVWDSLGSTPCRNELDEGTKDHNMKAALAITGGLRKTRYFLRKTNSSFLIINQAMAKQTTGQWQKKTKAKGGFGPEYFSSIILEFTRMGRITKQTKGVKEKIGIVSKVEAIKNHLAPPFQSAKIEIDRLGLIYGGRKAEK